MSFATSSACCFAAFIFGLHAAEWHREDQVAWRELNVPAGKPGFSEMTAPQTGVDFINLLSTNRYVTNQNILNGSGVALGDIDGDGLPDLLLAGLDSTNALYRNLGNWRFSNI